jgi:type IV secretory pathway VirB4 component
LPLRLPTHRASSATLAGAYPFLASAPLDRGVYVGTDAFTGGAFCFDPWGLYGEGLLTNPNVLLAGVIGEGKSALAKSLAIRSIACGRRVYVPGDPKGEWAPVAQAVGGQVIALGRGLATRLNPLDAGEFGGVLHGGATESPARAGQLRLLTSLAETTLRRDLRADEHTALDAGLTTAIRRTAGPVTLAEVVSGLIEPERDAAERTRDGRDLVHGLRRVVRGDLAGLFDGPSTVRLDGEAAMVVLDLSRLGAQDDALAIAMTCASAWLESSLAASGGLRWIIYDEAWRLLRSLPLVRRMQAQWKLSRAHGIANLLVLHRLSDLDAVGDTGSEVRALTEGLLADCSTRVIYRQETDQLTTTASALGLTDTERELLPALSRGTGLWKVAGRSYVVHHQLHVEEATVFDTDAAMRGAPSPRGRCERRPAGRGRDPRLSVGRPGRDAQCC